MADEKKEEKKSYTFLDKRGVDHDEPAPQKDLKGRGRTQAGTPAEPGPRADRIPGRRGCPFHRFHHPHHELCQCRHDQHGQSRTRNRRCPEESAVAQQNIDIITSPREDQGNLTAEENASWTRSHELRMVFVEAMKEER